MNDKKEKKKKHHFRNLIIVIVLAVVGGFLVAAFAGDYIPEELDIFGGSIEDPIIAKGLTISFGLLFIFLMAWLFLLTKSDDGGTPKNMIEGDYNVKSDQKGSARWLNEKEINELFPRISYDEAYKYSFNGFVVQTKRIGNKTYANYNKKDYHCLIIGSTGSGKTARFVIPTMQLLGRSKLHPSIIVTDPKAELYNSQTKLYKANGYDIISINLREGMKKSSCWNPCHMAYEEYQEALVQKDKIIRHTESLDKFPKLKLAGDKREFKEVWFEFGEYAFYNIKDAMIEAERKSTSLKSQAQESISDLCDTIYAESQRKASDPYWVKSGKSMVQGLLLAMLEDSEIKDLGISEQRFNLGTIYSILSLRVNLLKSYFNIRDASSNAKRIAASAVNAPESGTRESIISTALADLTSFADPDIQYITCNNDIDFKDIGRKPTVVFLIIPDEKENRHVFASLFITQAYKALVELASGPEGIEGKCPQPVDFIIDEFANMPVIPGMDNKITVARSRGISFLLIIQALSQLNAKYGQDIAKVISSNCNMQVFLASNDNETAEYFSKICGEKTTREKNVSVNMKGEESTSYSLSARALIKPEELLTLPEGTSIVKLLREQPAKLNQINFWQDPSYIKGAQKLPEKWNPKVFTFDVDGYYDIATRCKYDANYKIEHLTKYAITNTNDNDDNNNDDDDSSDFAGFSDIGNSSDSDSSKTNMEINNIDDVDEMNDFLKDMDLDWKDIFDDDDTPKESLATTAEIVNAAEKNKGLFNQDTECKDISNRELWDELFNTKSNNGI